jgi:hypothetical protein
MSIAPEHASDDMPTLYTPEEAAKATRGITASEIRGAIRNGEMAYVSGSRGRWLVTPAQVRAWIEHRTKPAAHQVRRERQPMGVTQRSANHGRRTR